MNRLACCLLLLPGCGLGETDLGSLGDTDATEAGTTEPSGRDTAATSTPSDSASDSADASTGMDPSGNDTTTGGETSSPTGETGATGDTDDETGSTETTGGLPIEMCELDGCWAECSQEFQPGPEFEGDIPCYGSSEGWEPPPCMEAGTELCDFLSADDLGSDQFMETTACFLNALAGDAPGVLRMTKFVGTDDTDEGTIVVVGEGTVLLDLRRMQHCGNGGTAGQRFILSRNMDVIDTDSEAFQACVATTEPEERLECVLGPNGDGTFDPNALPWLATRCTDAEPYCSF